MKKIVYLDIGTHFGQEFQSMFGSGRAFSWKMFRRFVAYFLLRKGEKISIKYLMKLMKGRKNLKKIRKDFLFYFVEANPKIINFCDVYKNAHGVFNCALNGEQKVSVANLFLANEELLGQGSSIFLSKNNVTESHSVPTLGVPSKVFFAAFKSHLDKVVAEYLVILRLNCEGVEDDVIYSAHEVFGNDLTLVMGSLKDVMECKGEGAYVSLLNYLDDRGLPFIKFSELITSWAEAHSSVNALHGEYLQ